MYVHAARKTSCVQLNKHGTQVAWGRGLFLERAGCWVGVSLGFDLYMCTYIV